MDLSFAGALQLADAIRSRDVSSVEVVEHVLARIERHNPALNAVVTLDGEGARRRAHEADRVLSRGEVWGALHGVPVTLKDGYATAGMRTTCGYPPLADYVPAEDSTVAARLKAAGAILVGKTNVPPLLGQPITDNPIFGRTNNPWEPARTPGGSSGGAAAALAAGLTPLDIGSDMGGSIRMPAHFCGVFGFKPTARRIPTTGHIPDLPGATRFDRVLMVGGPLGRSVEDLALAFRILAGPDGHDTDVAPVPFTEPPTPALEALRVAWASTFPGVPTARAIGGTVEWLARDLAEAGARVEERLPAVRFDEQHALWARYYRWFRYVSVALWGAAAPATGSSAEPPTALELIEMAHARDAFIRAWEAFFEHHDVFVCPAAIVTAFPHAAPGTPVDVDGAAAKYGQINHYCFPFNISGHPVVVVPAGSDADGLPIGVQLVGRRWDDERLLAIAARLVEITGPFVPPPGY